MKPLLTALCALLTLPWIAGCGGSGDASSQEKRQFLSVGTAPAGGAFFVVGNAIASVVNTHSEPLGWRVSAEATKGTQENIRRLDAGELDFALANAAITYFAARGEAKWEKPHDVRSVMTLAPNVALFITRADSGITSLADLKGKRVTVGPAGAGFEHFVAPILEAHGVAYADFSPLNATQGDAVNLLADGAADAAFLGGAVPTASITQACATMKIRFIPFDPAVRQKLVTDYPFFAPFTIKAGTYADLKEDFAGLNVGSMQLVTHAQVDEETVYQFTKLLYENRAEVVEQHPAGKAINPNNIARNTGLEFHPGTLRYFAEAGIPPAE